MNRRAFMAGALACAALPATGAAPRFAHGLLWRIGKGRAAPSHVYGTMHVPDARLAELPAKAERAFEHAHSLMVEFLADGYTRERFLEAALLPEGSTLEALIGSEDFARAVERLRPIGLAPELVNRLKPWGVLLNLRDARRAEGVPVDTRLVEQAQLRRLPYSQIEGVEEQIFTFDEFPLESQVALLKHSLAHADELAELGERTLAAYLAGDLAGIWSLRERFAARFPELAPHQAIMNKRVIYDRSVVMAFRMQRELRRGAAFVALGALHLYGAKGVLALLEQDGYRTARVA
ncbi:MAG TPA: TraB/GumN family protein [Burkholderiales bacterium]|nr:TraB/GumN family protein [Burkholderiales bacterium]